jgi:hypothetical protein
MEGIQALGAAAKAAGQALGEATASAHSFATARSLSGGTTGEIAALRAFGLSGEQIGSLSAGFRQRLSTDPLAMAAAGELGINPQLQRAFGPQNEAQFLVQAVEGLRGIQNEEERLRVARMTGLEDLLDVAKVSEKVFQGMKRDAFVIGTVFDEQTQQQARDTAAELNRVSAGLENLKVSVFSHLFQPVEDGANNFADTLNGVALLIKNNPLIDIVGQKVFGAMFPGALEVNGALADAGRQSSQRQAEESARQQNTNAILDLNRILGRMTGASGPRAEGAMPMGLRQNWPAIDAASRGAIRKGAWKL